MESKKVLLIDDESSLRRSLGISLLQQGYDTEPCESGVCALKKLKQYENQHMDLDYIVSDIKLPDIDGIKLSRIIKKKYPNVPVILITGYGDILNEEEIRKLHIDGYLQKPLSAEDLAHQFDIIAQGLETEVEERPEVDVAPAIEVKPAEEAPVQGHSVSAYMMIRLNDKALRGEKFIELYRKLYFMDNVLYCDSTNSDYDIVMLIQADDEKTLEDIYRNKVLKMEGVEDIDYLQVKTPMLDANLAEIIKTAEEALSEDTAQLLQQRKFSNYTCASVAIQIEKEKLDSIYPILRFDENVVYCDNTVGKYDLLLLMQGTQFNEINRKIEDKLRNIDGVLKIKKYPIINVFDGAF
ncbi:MAG: response regulator [Candidatus Cloacimonetes bacterium]|nr:response regulator [Candidatus Cloacimonadota bacterium]